MGRMFDVPAETLPTLASKGVLAVELSTRVTDQRNCPGRAVANTPNNIVFEISRERVIPGSRNIKCPSNRQVDVRNRWGDDRIRALNRNRLIRDVVCGGWAVGFFNGQGCIRRSRRRFYRNLAS